MRAWVRGAGLAAALGISLAFVPVSAAASQLSWSGIFGGHNATGEAITCPSASQCTMIFDTGSQGDELTFNPASPKTLTQADIDASADLVAIACPVATQCTAVGDSGAFTFDPTHPPSSPVTPLNAGGQSIACPAQTECVVVTATGGEITFDPTTGNGSQTLHDIDGDANLTGLSCPTQTQCTTLATSDEGTVSSLTFDPANVGSPTPQPLSDDSAGAAMACPPGVTNQCTAGDGNGHELTFDPNSPGTPKQVSVDSDGGFFGMACPAANDCTGVDNNGFAVTFDPTNPGTPQPVEVSFSPFSGVACPTTTECLAVDQSASVFLGTVPKIPAKPACTVAAKSNKVLLPAKNSQPVTGNEGKLFFNVKCSPAASVSLTGTLTEVLKQHTSHFTLTKVAGQTQAGATLTMTVALPKAAVTGLEQGAQESVAMSLKATDAGGASTATTSISKLRGVRA